MQTFSVSRYKGIRGTVEVSPDGSSIIVQGKNGSGKSSFVDGISQLFQLDDTRKVPNPIHEGEDSAISEFIDTERDVRLVREWKRDRNGKVKQTLTAFSLDGARYASASEKVAELTGGLIFDPSKFLLLDPKPQRDALLSKVELKVDLDQLNREQLAAEDDRLVKGQMARAAEGAVENADRVPPGTPVQPLSTAELVAEHTRLKDENNARRDAVASCQRSDDSLADFRGAVREAENALVVMRAELEEMTKRHEKLSADVAHLPPLHDLDELERKIASVDEVNRNVQLAQIRAKLESDAAAKREEWKVADDYVEAIIQRKKDALAEAVFPDPSLSVDDERVLCDGLPFTREQVNSAKQIRVALNIATAGNPELKLIFIKEGDLLDEESLAEVDRIATERGYTVLIERGRPDVGGLIATFIEMENGQVAE